MLLTLRCTVSQMIEKKKSVTNMREREREKVTTKIIRHSRTKTQDVGI